MKKTLFLYNKSIPVAMYREIVSEACQRLHIDFGFENIFFVCEFCHSPTLAVHDFSLADVIYVVMVGAYAVYAYETCLVFYRSCR